MRVAQSQQEKGAQQKSPYVKAPPPQPEMQHPTSGPELQHLTPQHAQHLMDLDIAIPPKVTSPASEDTPPAPPKPYNLWQRKASSNQWQSKSWHDKSASKDSWHDKSSSKDSCRHDKSSSKDSWQHESWSDNSLHDGPWDEKPSWKSKPSTWQHSWSFDHDSKHGNWQDRN